MRDDDFSARISRVRTAAAGRWIEILTGAGIPETHLLRVNRPCPLCGGKDRFTFFCREADGGWFCRGCGHGDGIQLLKEWRQDGFMDTLRYLERILGLPEWQEEHSGEWVRAKSSEEKRRREREEKLEAIWNEAEPLGRADKDNPVVKYLSRRGLAFSNDWGTLDLRSHSELEYWEQEEEGAVLKGRWPAMLARVTDENGRLLSLHRTYVTEEGEKAPVASPKKLMSGSVEGGLVKLYPLGEGGELGIAEGIETAAAAHCLCRIPVWSAISVGGFQNLKAIPEGIVRLVIFGDNDKSFAGQAGAWALAARLRREYPDLEIAVRIPEVEGYDWNDVWVKSQSSHRVPGKRHALGRRKKARAAAHETEE